MTKKSLFLVLAFFTLLIPSKALSSTKILSGEHTVIYDIINPKGIFYIPDYSNNSFSQKVIEEKSYLKRVKITSSLTPLKSNSPFPISINSLPQSAREFLKSEPDIQVDNRKISYLAEDIAGKSKYIYEILDKIINWVSDNVKYDTNTSQDAISVLLNRKGSCVGFSNLTLAMLRSLGIPARYARGFLPPGHNWGFEEEYYGVKINSGGFHAWIEVYFPDLGWVFTDPLHSKNFVDPFHLLFHIKGTDLNPGYGSFRNGEEKYIRFEDGTSFTIFKEDDNLEEIDALSNPQKTILGRRYGDRQYSFRVYGQVKGLDGEIVKEGEIIVWEGSSGRVHKLNKDGSYNIVGLEAKQYKISVRAKRFAEGVEEINYLDEKVRTKRIDFVLGPGGEVKGTVKDKHGNTARKGTIYVWEGNTGRGFPIAEDGSFLIIGLKPQKYKITTSVRGFLESTQWVEINAGETKIFDFVIEKE